MNGPTSTPDIADETPLSAATAEALIERVAQIGESGAPLAAGLRAAADEADSRRLARGLRYVAAQIERGRSLDDAIAGPTGRLPPHLAGLIRAAQRTGHLGTVLSEWIENRRAARVHWQSVTGALAYPALTLALTALIYILFAAYVVRPFRTVVDDFGLVVPVNLNVLFWLSGTGLVWFFAGIGILAAILIVLRLAGGRYAWSWMMTQLPLFGGAWHWTGVAEMLRCLGLLVERRLPLPEALRLTGDGISDAYVGSLCRDLAARVDAGTPMYVALVQQRSLPLSIVPLVRWGEQHGVLAEGLKSAAEMLEGRLQMRSAVLVQVIPPVIFLTVGVMLLTLLGAVGGTMLSLLQGLI